MNTNNPFTPEPKKEWNDLFNEYVEFSKAQLLPIMSAHQWAKDQKEKTDREIERLENQLKEKQQ